MIREYGLLVRQFPGLYLQTMRTTWKDPHESQFFIE